MSENDSQREKFLELLEGSYKEGKRWNKYASPGIEGKLKRLLFIPDLYLPYLFFRSGLYLNNKKVKINLFWGKDIFINLGKDPDVFPLYLLGVLPYQGEYKLTKFFIKNLDKDDVFYDIGASYGFYTHLALEFCEDVHSFEPNPRVFENLSRNLKKPNAKVNKKIVSNQNKPTKLYSMQRSAGSTINREAIAEHDLKEEEVIESKSIKLDDYVEEYSNPTFIKIDVEGAESKVIEGGAKVSRK